MPGVDFNVLRNEVGMEAAVDLCRVLAREVPWVHRW
jgi:hypothetical protein